MTKYPYTSERQDDGSFLVQFLDFPEGFTEGATAEEAAKNAQEVLDLLVETYKDEGKALPKASAPGDLPVASV